MCPGSQPDRTNLTVNVTEQSTAALSVGLGYSSTTSLLGEVSYTDSNWFGRGQNLRVVAAGLLHHQAGACSASPSPISWTATLAAGFDIYETQTNFEQATYQSDTTAAVLRLGFPDLGIQLGVAELQLPDPGHPPLCRRAAGCAAGRRLALRLDLRLHLWL